MKKKNKKQETICCCCCQVASVVSDSERPRRRLAHTLNIKPPLSIVFSPPSV